MKKQDTTNTFQEGMMMDLNPLVTPNSVVTNCLNGTIVTYNGNENVLQNDMGNGRVETARLPEGYVPLGTTLLGGIIYILSYNPMTSKCLIGSFPSPERNFTTLEIGNTGNLPEYNQSDLISEPLYSDENGSINLQYVNKDTSKYRLSDKVVHPGDKFIVFRSNNETLNTLVSLNIGILDNNGRIILIEDPNSKDGDNKYLEPRITNNIETIAKLNLKDPEDYNIFTSKISGELYVIAKLNIPSYFDVNYELESIDDDKKSYTFKISHNFNNDTVYYSIGNGYSQLRDNTITVNQQSGIVTFTFIPSYENLLIPSLKTQFSINLDLIGSGKLESNLWRYFVDDDGIDLNWGAQYYIRESEVISKMELAFLEISKGNVSESKVIVDIPLRKNYSGNYNTRILKSQLPLNKLYLATIRLHFGDGTIKEIHHILYTNKIYNGYYSMGNDTNFDNLSLDIITDISLSKTEDNIKYILLEKEKPLLIKLSTLTDYSFEYADEYKLDGNLEFNIDYKVRNDGGLIEINGNLITLNGITSKITTKSGLIKSTNQELDENLIKEEDLSVAISSNINGRKITVTVPSTTLKNKLVGEFNQTSLDIKVNNLYTPIVYNSDTAFLQGLGLNTNTAQLLSNTYYSAGFAGGGADNKGGGAYRFIGGKHLISNDGNVLKRLCVTSSDGGDSFKGFPFQYFNDILLLTNISLIPVYLARVAGNMFIGTPSNKNKLIFRPLDDLRYVDLDTSQPITSNNFKKNFELDSNSNINTGYLLLLFMRTTTNLFFAFNTFFKLTDPFGKIAYYPGSSNLYNLANVFLSLYTLLYIKLSSGDFLLKAFFLKDYMYYDKLVKSLDFEIKYTLNALNDSNVFVSGAALSTILSNVKKYFDNNSPLCLKVSNYNDDTSYDYLTQKAIELQKITILPEVLKNTGTGVSLDNYAISLTGESINVQDNIEGNLLVVYNGALEKLSSYNISSIKYINSFNVDGLDNINLLLKTNENLIPTGSHIEKTLTWNKRENRLELDSSLYSGNKAIKIEAGKNNDDTWSYPQNTFNLFRHYNLIGSDGS